MRTDGFTKVLLTLILAALVGNMFVMLGRTPVVAEEKAAPAQPPAIVQMSDALNGIHEELEQLNATVDRVARSLEVMDDAFESGDLSLKPQQ